MALVNRYLIGLFAVSLLLITREGAAVSYDTDNCSSKTEEANINELVMQGPTTIKYVEIKILEDNVDVGGWELCTYNANGTGEKCEEFGDNKTSDKAFLVNDTSANIFDVGIDRWDTPTYLSWETSISGSEGQIVHSFYSTFRS